ncbi:ADP-ribosylglycohydrolase family protein [Paenibacillus lignilyticus]|uniref:ADP-ribosylglycohydrolase family protein n=1 Tax=Paenibacillus lignilyticus TaxID=1172615 RepID=A0ABS5C708_9BACL|nr:ADP-ribosylglycohydrolase family protein [Paenibacillus lignilyticus]MBP3961779.1 ADP-ribosylglycohydrolase family protein [Paenibacillus lignilyticus]MBP3963550.1 ADP-ribosylglycohydrolase family protein [Paenibacillus lignilyticus]
MMAKYRLTYENYLDKVYGAWLGKSIAGTIGAPFEGRKELFDYEYDPRAIKEMLPNDDLDLQVLWLHVLEQKGVYFTSMDLADAFYERYPFVPGEYAWFKKNYNRGIYPPVSGAFNNRYYVNGMGCPIRSEIWACVAPGNPELAAEFAGRDGMLDHEGDSIYAEQYLAAVEAMAFVEDDLMKLLRDGMVYLPEGTRIRRLVEDTMAWSSQDLTWQQVRSRIIRDYGHPDCTNLYQNIGFTLVCLFYGKGDFLETTMIALNCGFDTDCSCATAGALLGIIYGADRLIEKHAFYDTSYKLDVKVARRSNQLSDLAEDTCAAGLTIMRELNGAIEITGQPSELGSIPANKPEPSIVLSVDYQGIPVVGWSESKTIAIGLSNETEFVAVDQLTVDLPDGWQSDWTSQHIVLQPGEIKSVTLTVSVPEQVSYLSEKNLLTAAFGGATFIFGLNGAQVWKVFGPFWENHIELPRTELGEWYYGAFKGTRDEIADLTRQFHLNTKADATKDYRSLVDPQDYRFVNVTEDLFSVSDLIGFQGPCVVYAEREIELPEDREVNIIFGHTEAYRLWINDQLISETDHHDWWTAENRHHSEVKLRQGRNKIVLQAIRRGRHADYSLIFTELGQSFPHHITDLGSWIDHK